MRPEAPEGVAGLRRWLSPRSLRVQMAVGSALIALGAVIVVALVALLVSAINFNAYRQSQLEAQIGQLAQVLGRQQEALASGDVPSPTSGRPLSTVAQDRFGALNVWILNPKGLLLARPGADLQEEQLSTADVDTIQTALRHALAGTSEHGLLPGASLPWQIERFYAAAPVRAGGASGGTIVGAVALSTQARADRGLSAIASVSNTILLTALAAALLAALVAALASRRVTRPLSHLTAASVQMAGGDYAARVAVRAPEELHRLAASFNEMAAALEGDVTKLREQERLRRELVANVSHELATPLTAIQGFTEALLDGVVAEPEARNETTQLIAREAARLRRLVEQLREVTTYEGEGGTRSLQLAPVVLPALIAETLAVLAPELERKRIALSSDVPADLPAVNADADRLTEILLNLLDNALRFTPDNGRIEVAAYPDGGFVRVTVADSGPGVPPAERERIFERFYRADPSRSSATGGTGLGLAIVRELVVAHGGMIAVDERPSGGGARFTFTLPLFSP